MRMSGAARTPGTPRTFRDVRAFCDPSDVCRHLKFRRHQLRLALDEQMRVVKQMEAENRPFTEMVYAWDDVEEITAKIAHVSRRLNECIEEARFSDQVQAARDEELSRRQYDL